MEQLKGQKIGFVGAGNMASAIIRGLLDRRLVEPKNLLVTDILTDKVNSLAKQHGIVPCASPTQLLGEAQIVILAVKPQDFLKLLDEQSSHFGPQHLVISIAAGIRSESITKRLPAGVRVVRVMPNTPALVGLGTSGVAAGPEATPQDMQTAMTLFEAVGLAVEVEESQMDAITALSGSGPAYVFRFIELMAQAGTELGLDAEQAKALTTQTFEGALRLLRESGESPGALREKVTSKGGTTAAALASFEADGLPDIFRRALGAARDRSIELSREPA